jgi:phosphoribosylanthranilate isomerase
LSLFVKICGITDALAGEACAEAGADAVGFVFATSPRQVTPEQAMAIASSLPESILKVAVFRRPSSEEVERVLGGFTPDAIQADHDVLPDGTGMVLLPVYREDGDAAPKEPRFRYEGPVSGAGERVDFARAALVAARHGEMILAGGLTPGNVSAAIDRVRPFGVDVSSGVEREPGIKDPDAIRSFVSAAHEANERLVSR